MKNTWQVKAKLADDVVEHLLLSRGLKNQTDREHFLEPDWQRDTFDPQLFKMIGDAVNRVFLALKNGQRIVIHGDYDADGVSGSTLLFDCLQTVIEKLDFDVPKIEVFLPDRERDGYGIARHTVERLAREGCELLITVDCGIAHGQELDRAAELGVDVIVCDHHQLGEHLPQQAMILHPLAPGEDYPNKKLCGTGVAFKFASALIHEARTQGAALPEGYEKWFLDLVAIATVTDVMPLIGENRTLEKFGLQVLNKTRRPGLLKIIELSRTELGSIDTQAIGFQIGPRLNAAGRIKSAEIAFKALNARTEAEAQKFAEELEMLNRERQRISEVAYREARAMIKDRQESAVHVVWSETWSPGIVGLIAGKLVNEFGTPAFALTKVGEEFVGSGRSIGGLHLVKAMRSCGDIFVKAGGHPQACGLTIAKMEEVLLFQERVNTFAVQYFGESKEHQILEIDAEIPVQKINEHFYDSLQKFEPFGEQNPKPIFLSQSLQVVAAERMGKDGKHLRLSVTPTDGPIVKFVGFGFGKSANDLEMGSMVDIVYEINENIWNNTREIQGRIIDLDKTS